MLLEMGTWKGTLALMVVPLDDFEVILGMNFLLKIKDAIVPHLGGLMILDKSNPSFVAGAILLDKKSNSMISAIQLENGFKQKMPTYFAALIEVKPGVTQDVLKSVVKVMQEFEGVFPSELPKELPPRRTMDHQIELEPSARAPVQAPYRMPPAELAELWKKLDELLNAGLVQPSKAPYGLPVLFQKKQDGSLRFCINCRALNKVNIKNKYLIPNALDLFDKLSRARLYTKIGLRSGYWQVRISPGDEANTTCVTRYGSFEFLVMHFGLTNASTTFCNIMNDVLYE